MPMTKLRRQRLIIWKMIFELFSISSTHHAMGSGPIGPNLTLLFVLGAVVATDEEQLPATSSKIAAYLGIPRETVRRHLQALVDAGLLERVDGVYRPSGKASKPNHVGRAIEIVKKTAELL